MMLLVTAVTVVGLQAVGLILIIALLITPAAAARFWTNHLRTMLVAAGLIGAASGFLGCAMSAVVPRLPAGAIIVLVAAGFFLASLLLGTRRGVLIRLAQAARLHRTIRRQHLLRAMFEWHEGRADGGRSVPVAALLRARAWSPRQLARQIRRARRDGLLAVNGDTVEMTDHGFAEAARLARNHRLWEMYLITHADIAASHVDRDADQIEHVLGPEMVRSLEMQLAPAIGSMVVPASPHALGEGGAE
jgi:manganese/zinc/iron transport system permease protein